MREGGGEGRERGSRSFQQRDKKERLWEREKNGKNDDGEKKEREMRRKKKRGKKKIRKKEKTRKYRTLQRCLVLKYRFPGCRCFSAFLHGREETHERDRDEIQTKTEADTGMQDRESHPSVRLMAACFISATKLACLCARFAASCGRVVSSRFSVCQIQHRPTRIGE